MNESIRTLIFVGLAGVVGLAAWQTRPATVALRTNGVVEPGTMLFPDFKDPLTARSLEVVKFDEPTAAFQNFEVAQKGGRWVIPSHDDYPADAENQLRDAAAALIDLEALGIASEVANDHSLLGVVEPDQAKLKVGDQGVGTLVAVQDAKGDDLMRLIVGKAVEGDANMHFVRKPNEERVYVTKIDLTKLPTDFDKWIEKDLLKLSPLDVSHLTLKDYSILPTANGPRLMPRMEAELTYNSAADVNAQWKLDKMSVFSQRGEERDGGLSGLEELNKQKLDDLRNALDDLKIINVAKKPDELVNLLREGAELDENQLSALNQFGFELGPGEGGKLDVYGSSGELVVDTKDGVRYTLRFGKIAGTQDAPSTPDPATGETDGGVKVNRYLFVGASVSPQLTPPQLEPETAGPETPAASPPAEAPPAEPATGESGSCQAEEPAGKSAAKSAAKAASKAADEADSSDDKPAAEAKPGDVPAAPDPSADPAAAERERVKRENERKMNEYREKKTKAENRVRELNNRFADWYYIVSEDVYKKLRLSRSDFVKEGAAAAEEGFGIDAFRKLEEGGPEAKAPPAAPPATPAFPPAGFPPM